MTPTRPATRLDFEIAIICALPIEADAIEALFDHRWDDDGTPYDKALGDPNAYSVGSIGRHNVVLAHMPSMGQINAAIVASKFHTSFPSIKLALVVGVCGVMPFSPQSKRDIFLGDVIISSGIIQYDFEWQLPEKFKRKDTLLDSPGRPNMEIRALLKKLEGIHGQKTLRSKMVSHIAELQNEPELEARYPGVVLDKLFNAKYRHIIDEQTCEECGCSNELILRHRFDQGIPQPAVHFGLIASGNTVMMSGEDRDQVARQDCIGFETEGAGTWDMFPCVVIKGACDYADSHKTQVWQRYAAATAAACTKAFLEYWVPSVIGKGIEQLASNTFALSFSLSEATEVAQFVGRKEELAQVHSILNKAEGRRTAVLHGLGGIGKTQLVIAYLKSYQANYSATIWLNARDEKSLQQSYARAAERIHHQYPLLSYIKTAMKNRDPDEMTRAVKRWLDEPTNDRWLVVYDNYDFPKFENESESDEEGTRNCHTAVSEPQAGIIPLKAFDIRPFFPTNYHGAVIITTRSSTIGIGESIFLRKLTDVKDSLEILRFTSHRQHLESDESALELIQQLDGLPLALATAGAYLNQVSTSWTDYLKLYKQSWLRLQQKSPVLLSYENRALYSTWDISYRQIERKNHAAAMILHLWAYLDNEDLWYELLQCEDAEVPPWLEEVVQDRISFDEAMRVVCDHGLAETDTRDWGVDSRGYSVHECVHSWMMFGLNAEQNTDMARLAIRCVALRIPNEEQANYELVQRRLLVHADICSLHISKLDQLKDEEYMWFYSQFGYLYSDQGRLGEAEVMYNQALQSYEKAFGPDYTSTLDTANNLGNLHAQQGRYSKAEAMYDRALQGYEKTLGPEHILTLGTVNNLGLLYEKQGRYSEAEVMYNRAFQGYEKALGPEHPSTLGTVNNLGNILFKKNQGRYGEAEAMYNRVLQGREKAWGPDHTSTLDTVNNLGILYISQGRYSEAEAMYDRALPGKEKALGPEHPSTLGTVNNLGLLYEKQGRYSEAEAMYNRAFQGYEKVLGLEHPSTLGTVNNVGSLYKSQGRYSEAEAMYNRALQGYEKALRAKVDTYPPALDTLENLGNLFHALEKFEQARNYYNRAEAGFALTLGRESEQCRRISSILRQLG